MTTDLDALEARAKTRQAIDSPDVLALIAELRQERERAELVYDAYLAKMRALSRAEETIEKVEDFVTRHYLDTHVGEKVIAILTEYGKQKGVDRG